MICECTAVKAVTELNPETVLLEAWHTLQQAKLVGSATACLVAMHPQKSELRAANVGDAGFIILRPNAAARARPFRGTLDAAGVISCDLV